jgi:SIR2-like domain/NACHT domain
MSERALKEITDSARRRELVCVIGTGVSITLTNNAVPALAWKGLIQAGFAHAVEKGRLTQAGADKWKPMIESDDLDDLLAAAEVMGKKLGAPADVLYARFLENTFKDVAPTNKPMEAAINSLVANSIPLATLNYDTLLERVTGQPTLTLADTVKAAAWMRQSNEGILHLHGAWDAPDTCVLGIRDYQMTLDNDRRDLVQRALSSYKRLLFIGCGDTFADPNFASLIEWLRTYMKTAALEHYAIVRETDVSKRNADPSWQGFVSPVSYGPRFDDLPKFLQNTFPPPAAPSMPTDKKADESRKATNALNERLIGDYRAFLLKDCGQLAIEGVRADMNVAQRKFDLERIFVPLSVQPLPPDLPASDPQREEKLAAWHKEHSEAVPFGPAFNTDGRLALLALPGGGKTLLLRRLAVAYADPGRRQSSTDELPDLDLVPVLIRCREWRDHLTLPIPTLLKKLPEVTGQPHLDGVHAALLPLFKVGNALLLVDGLDEIHDDATRATFVEHLESFVSEHQKCRLVVTSREAGFALVAPNITRFCSRWRVAPLSEEAISLLCSHWHSLMSGDSPESQKESADIAELLTSRDSLRRLAENPLLLTMLLVVKQGSGRLPPDRVSLYGRAVEVLLDTWNIKGHKPLILKEAVPQLAYVAYELLRAGKQTATETELLELLEKARRDVSQVELYAKDTPLDFLRRVELRSSLLVEVGRQGEGAGTTPIYQFRHLTFQEYLAAVAAVDGYYAGNTAADTVLKPLAPYLTADEWKEVIPMAAVLAKNQADPLLRALISAPGTAYRRSGLLRKLFGGAVSAPVERLLQSLLEEAQASPEVRTDAVRRILVEAAEVLEGVGAVMFPNTGLRRNLIDLSLGVYGDELRRQAWRLFASLDWDPDKDPRYACGVIARQATLAKTPQESHAMLLSSLASADAQTLGFALLAVPWIVPWSRIGRPGPGWVASIFGRKPDPAQGVEPSQIETLVEAHLGHGNAAVKYAAILAWISLQEAGALPASPHVLDVLLGAWLAPGPAILRRAGASALAAGELRPRDSWTPALTDGQISEVRSALIAPSLQDTALTVAALTVAYHSKQVISDQELVRLLEIIESPNARHKAILSALKGEGAQ